MKAPRIYQIEWITPAAVEAKAKANGMPEGYDSWLDYAEPDDCTEVAERPTFAEAVELAKSVLHEDFFGCIDIARLVLIQTPGWKDRWVIEASWIVEDYDAEPAEDEPDDCPELELYPHESMPD